ncbi:MULTISPECIES: multiubiquitin domain-containing protein [Rhizobium]|uniref:Multiubiquitin domain-containing protein n=1 Tax=Rhizobium phaseoli TaxID=396 RepID=A0A192TJH2_9HYPH|nr:MULTISPECIES: multiubiquitin domain-containing protein [Rhizobium]ANL43366.1 hypothetical protein AMC88_PB00290 [Rhizobium phaseoli]ANL56366.1 hypothetical protein AMC86_PC00291 [Rhizobium phaseoli]ANL62352.1 hypothetical protein AMC85_PB00290 [Rhizobium phaseoli]ANL87766.1 hypothetical protein AMC81_PC00291 [Rhizobium phaseoli]ANL94275.1 hypothetical protein AMC80_PC00291 [Rhizobium phaseoli]
MTEVQAATDTGRHPPYKIIVDRKPHDWPEPFITGAQIKRIAGVDQTMYDAWQDVSGPEDLVIADDTKVDLRPSRVERFFTGKKTTTEG